MRNESVLTPPVALPLRPSPVFSSRGISDLRGCGDQMDTSLEHNNMIHIIMYIIMHGSTVVHALAGRTRSSSDQKRSRNVLMVYW
ncbi:hypothetical protein BDV26DRAFT_240891 [Aspergillus bertholletiae]|uniref:Uncharacterized protein n=1 Tax=Aspergillus bertholletiae TaxID=1226010 RepID=A0A5N7B2M8_9EURO|nr:hypothetical protein BDV26DRAFT_240891 [Aspergillus bertholletiae]